MLVYQAIRKEAVSPGRNAGGGLKPIDDVQPGVAVYSFPWPKRRGRIETSAKQSSAP